MRRWQFDGDCQPALLAMEPQDMCAVNLTDRLKPTGWYTLVSPR